MGRVGEGWGVWGSGRGGSDFLMVDKGGGFWIWLWRDGGIEHYRYNVPMARRGMSVCDKAGARRHLGQLLVATGRPRSPKEGGRTYDGW